MSNNPSNDDVHPFSCTEDGHYEVVQPVSGMTPEVIEVENNGVTYRLSDFRGTSSQSRVLPDVLTYAELEVIAE